ncbi:hypothetical protein TanjilG_17833 [Lupinus angustifolius]|uniref:Uncharacterized protein n=1 Tax=Lupinus angustifolius TaxID=3871 RepID=A0A4P1QPX6_LUPAN|nr:hypothetical protein TanjilG_17833 [Lupinus angustifolius]
MPATCVLFVAEKVIVTIKHNDDDTKRRIKDFVKKHSEPISYPIYLWTEKTPVKEEVIKKEIDMKWKDRSSS